METKKTTLMEFVFGIGETVELNTIKNIGKNKENKKNTKDLGFNNKLTL